MIYRRFGKRMVDVAASVFVLVAFSPLLALLALLVRVKLGSPVLFRQQRPGRHGEPFVLLKFRTMTDARDAGGNLLPDTVRLTPFGAFLRSTSLDELPELVNVLRGEMSLVGPRPLLMRYDAYFTQEERVRSDLRPGITGLAQISGRNDLPWDERLAADVRYVQTHSLAVDIRILASTVRHAVTRSGVRVDPSVTMPDLDDERRKRLEHSAKET